MALMTPSNVMGSIIKVESTKSLNLRLIEHGLSVSANLSLPLVNITLKNGTILKFGTVENATKFLYSNLVSGKLSTRDIENITTVYFSNYMSALKGEKNLTALDVVPGYKVFFLRKKVTGNYSTNYIPVSEGEAFTNKVDMLTRNLLYGKIGNLTITDINGERHLVRDYDFSVIIFLNTSQQNITMYQFNELKENVDRLSNESIIFYLIDISNNRSFMVEANRQLNNSRIIFALDSNITINDKPISLYLELGFKSVTPSSTIISSEGLILRKNFGVENITTLLDVIKILKEGAIGLVKYIISSFYLEKAEEGATTDTVVVLSDGFGEIDSVIGSYFYIYKNGSKGDVEKATFDSLDGRVFRHTILIPNDTIQIVWNITIKTELYDETITFTLRIKGKEELGKQPETQALYWILPLLILVLIAFISYKRVKK